MKQSILIKKISYLKRILLKLMFNTFKNARFSRIEHKITKNKPLKSKENFFFLKSNICLEKCSRNASVGQMEHLVVTKHIVWIGLNNIRMEFYVSTTKIPHLNRVGMELGKLGTWRGHLYAPWFLYEGGFIPLQNDYYPSCLSNLSILWSTNKFPKMLTHRPTFE